MSDGYRNNRDERGHRPHSDQHRDGNSDGGRRGNRDYSGDGSSARYGDRDNRDRRGSYRDDDRRRDDRRGSYRDDGRRRDDRQGSSRDDDRRGRERRGPSRNDDDRSRGRSHAQRAGADRASSGSRTQRPNFREERLEKKRNEPTLPSDLTTEDLDPSIIQDLKSLARDNAETVGKHLVMAATLMDEDPQLALKHARAAKDRAGRVGVVRETLGIAAYRVGEWKEALSELRAARRMSGGPGMLAVIADCERGLGRPEKAIDIARSDDAQLLSRADKIELGIVVAGARQDMGDTDGAVVELARLEPSETATGVTASRLNYMYADALAAAGRTDEAIQWFEHASTADIDGFLDSQDRIAALKDELD